VQQLKAISNLAPATSLRELNLADSGVADLQGLEKLVALETLDVTNIRTRTCPSCGSALDWSRCRPKGTSPHSKVSSTLQRLPSSIAACTSIVR
jgi:Leucine-rich repeat (LRR) protein